MTAKLLSIHACKRWLLLFSFVIGSSLQVSCQKSSSSSAGAGSSGGGKTTAEEEVDFEVSGTIDPTDFAQAQDSVEISGVNLTTTGKYAISAFYLSPLGKKVSIYLGTSDGERFSFKSKVPKRYLTIDVTRPSDGYRLGAFLPPALRNKLAKLRLNRTSSIAATMANIIADKAAAGDEAALKALATNSISVADTLVLAQSVARVITEQETQNKGSSIDLAALTAKLIEKSNDKIAALQGEGQAIAVVAEKISEKTYETVFSGDAEVTSPGVLAYRTNHDLGTSTVAKRDVAYEAIKDLSGDSTKYVDAAFRVEANAFRSASGLSDAVAAENSVATTYNTKFSECYAGNYNCAPAGYTPPSPPSSSSTGNGGNGSGSGSGSNPPAIPVITIISQPSNQTAVNGSATFSVSASVTQNAALSYQWQKKEAGTASFANISGATSTFLPRSGLTAADDNGDIYSVVISATGGADPVSSDAATLTVAAAVPAAPTSMAGTAGNAQASLTWSAPSNNGGSAITDYVIQYSSNSGITWTTYSDGISINTNALVTGLTNGTAYTFQVAAVNNAGTGNFSSSSSSVMPSAPIPVITITSDPANQTASSGSATFSVTATATNSANLSYQWQKQENGSGAFNDVGTNSATLSLSSLTNADDNNDVYRVVVSSTGGATSVTSRHATLTVNPCAPNGWCVSTMTYYIGGAATDLKIDGNGTWNGQTYTNGSLKAVITITSQPADQTASNGSAAFSVTATATNGATLSYQWQKQEAGAVGYSHASPVNTVTLSLSGLTNGADNGDTYRVLVSASGDATTVTSDSATLTVTIPPSSPAATINTQPTNHFSTSPGQIVSFSVGATGDNIGYQWQYYGSDDVNDDNETRWRDIGGATSASYAISQQAANAMGSMHFSYTQTLQLRCVVTPAGGQSITSSVARFVYIPLQHQLGIKWVSSSGAEANFGSPSTITLSTGGEFYSPETVTLELTENFVNADSGWYSGNDTVLKVQMASSNSSNDADWTTIHSMATRADTTTGTTTFYSPPATTGTKYYRVIAESMWPYTTINGTASVAMPTPYRWSGAASDTLQANWPAPAASVPAAPTSVSGTVGNAQASLTWTVPASNGGAEITDYVVQYSINGGSSWTTFDDGTSTSASATVTGLTNGTAYTFQVAAVNSAGTGSYSSSSSPVTPIAPTPVISITSQPGNQTASGGSANFSVTATATNSANLSYQWQKQEGGSGAFNNVGTDSATLSLSGLTNADDNNDVYRVVVSATGGAVSVTSNAATLTVNPCPADDGCVAEAPTEGWNLLNINQLPSFTQSLSVSSQETLPSSLFFKPDGTKMYIIGTASDSVHEYSLSSAWDTSTASFIQSLSVSDKETTPNGLDFKPDGTKMYIIGTTSDSVHEYSLSSAWDLTTASFIQSLSVGGTTAGRDNTPVGVRFSPDGLNMYFVGSTRDRIFQYTLSSSWDISTATFLRELSVAGIETNLGDLFFSPDGLTMFFLGTERDAVFQFKMQSAWLIPSSTGVTTQGISTIQSSFSVSSKETAPTGLFFKADGSKMFIVGTISGSIHEYNLPFAWNVANHDNNSTFNFGYSYPITGFSFNSDGSKLFVLTTSNANRSPVGPYVDEFSLSSNWDPSSHNNTINRSFDLGTWSISSGPRELRFSPDGLKMYFVKGVENAAANDSSVHEFSLSSAWDISTANFVQFLSVVAQDATPEGVYFKNDGSRMYVIGSTNDSVYEYSLSSAWNISTASLVRSFSIASEGAAPRSIHFSSDGLKMYTTGTTDGSSSLLEKVNQYSLSSAWDISTASLSASINLDDYIRRAQSLFFTTDGLDMYLGASSNNASGPSRIYKYSPYK